MTGEPIPADTLLAWELIGLGASTRTSATAHLQQHLQQHRRATPRPASPRAATPRSTSPRAATPRSTSPRAATPRPATPRPASPRAATPRPALPDAAEDVDTEEEEPTIEVLQSRERYLTRFKSSFREEVMSVKGMASFIDPNDAIVTLFDTVIQRQCEAVDARPHDRCVMEIRGSEDDEKPVWFSLRRTDQLSGQVIADRLALVIQSNQSFMKDGMLQVSFIHIPTPEAGGVSETRPNETMDSWIQRRIENYSIFDPANTVDQMCLFRSIAYSSGIMNSDKLFLNRLKQPASRVLHMQAHELRRMCGFEPNQTCDIDDVKKVQEKLPHHRLVVFSDMKGKDVVFKGPATSLGEPRKNIYLLWHGAHFYAILNVKSAFSHQYYCAVCLVGFRNAGEHKCASSCWRCLSPHVHPDNVPLIRCALCARHFAGEECLAQHQLPQWNGKSTCHMKKFCSNCLTTYNFENKKKGWKHKCGQMTCRYCRLEVDENHLCYMTPWEPKERSKKARYMTVYFDTETCQNEPMGGTENSWRLHRPNVLISQQLCDTCVNVKECDHTCDDCGERQHIFHSLDDHSLNVVAQFLDHLQTLSSQKKTEILLFCHNFRSFDGYFIIDEVLKRNLPLQVIQQGAKIISLKVGGWTFKDSLMFVSQKLSSLPKSFGLDSELCKGYFPYLFNQPEFYKYKGEMPALEYYCTQSMSRKEKSGFQKWYRERVEEGYVFDFRQEILSYAVSDVTILREAMQCFRFMFSEIAGFDPLFHCLTLSSACMCMYRLKHMPLYKIGIVPQGGYRGRDKQSFVALEWLDFEQHFLGDGVKIKTAECAREVRMLDRPVDGYVEIVSPRGRVEKRICQFHGCYFHSCPKCYPNPDRVVHGPDGMASNRYEKTVQLSHMFRKNVFFVKEMWECMNYELKKSDPAMRAFFEGYKTERFVPLRLRDALYGGRTSAIRSYVECDLTKSQVLRYVDVTSQYPNSMLRFPFVAGHPTIFLKGDPNMPPVDQWGNCGLQGLHHL
ncbi:hypothetical protein ONE63_008134 [Megalurothrips usitatus]|uniref:DNA-directed DNA polymerase n=1 Tax=Megalurothrips usitatus TaxID=439358 RepID=A0AAV7XNT7_9NEOP|nr:hypothetical protein ONE63_008134 [Megalurothrips usitatus]